MGLTKTNAVKMSVRRWEQVIERLEQGDGKIGLFALNSGEFGDCGLCDFHHPDSYLDPLSSHCCDECPLYPDICSHSRWELLPRPTFWKFCGGRTTAEEQLPLAREILQAIKDRGAKWIAEGKGGQAHGR